MRALYVTGHPNDGASARSIRLSPLFPSACVLSSLCLGRTRELPLDTPSTQRLGRHPANSYLPSPNRNTPPPTPIGPFALQGNTTADPQ
jgi:hypothetical protein